MFLAMMALMVPSTPVSAAGATSTVRIVKYDLDGVTVLAEKQVSYEWMKAMLPVYGDGRTHYYHQGPVFEGDLWDPEEIHNLKDKGAVMGSAVKDLCDQVGGMSRGDDIALVSVDKWHTELAFDNIYEPLDNQGIVTLCWYNGEDADEGEKYGVGYPANNAFRTALQIVFMSRTANSEGKLVFGNKDMQLALPEEKYQHFYEGEYPSTNGLSGKWIAEIRIYSGGIRPDQQIDWTAANYYGTHTSVPEDTGKTIHWIPIVLGVAGLLCLAAAVVILRKTRLLSVKKGAVMTAGILLMAASIAVGIHQWQSTPQDIAGWTLTLVGRDGRQTRLEYGDVIRMPSYTGKGGYFSTVGVVYGPYEGKGVPLTELCQLVGGVTSSSIIMVSAADGYSTVLDFNQVTGKILTYNPQTMKEIPHGELKPVLMFQQDGKPLSDDDGKPLRIAILGSDSLLTEGNAWVKWVNKIEVLEVEEMVND